MIAFSTKRTQVLAVALVLTALGLVVIRQERSQSGSEEPAVPEHAALQGSRPAAGSATASVVATAPGLRSQASVSSSVPACCQQPARGTAAMVVVKPNAQRVAARESVPRHELSSPQSWSPVDPLAPGNSLSAPGGAIFVHATQHDVGATGVALDLRFAPVPSSSSSADAGAAAEAGNSSSEGRSSMTAAIRPGLTYEQELFRTKWGWAAFDQAQRKKAEFGAEQ